MVARRISVGTIDRDGPRQKASIALVNLDGSNDRKVPLPPGPMANLMPSAGIDSRRESGPSPSTSPRIRNRPWADTRRCSKNTRPHFNAYEQSRKTARTEEEARPGKVPPALGRISAGSSRSPGRPPRTRWPSTRCCGWCSKASTAPNTPSPSIDSSTKPGPGKWAVEAGSLASKVSPSVEKLLTAVVEKNPDLYVRGLACLTLGQYLKCQSERVRSIREDPESAGQWEAMYVEEGAGKESFDPIHPEGPGRPVEAGRGGAGADPRGVRQPARRRRSDDERRSGQTGRGCPGRAGRDPQPGRRQAGTGDQWDGH